MQIYAITGQHPRIAFPFFPDANPLHFRKKRNEMIISTRYTLFLPFPRKGQMNLVYKTTNTLIVRQITHNYIQV